METQKKNPSLKNHFSPTRKKKYFAEPLFSNICLQSEKKSEFAESLFSNQEKKYDFEEPFFSNLKDEWIVGNKFDFYNYFEVAIYLATTS